MSSKNCWQTLTVFYLDSVNYSPKNVGVFETLQQTYGKKSLKILKSCVTRWLTYGMACKRVLVQYEELLQTLDHLCAEILGYRIMLSSHRVLFMLRLMANPNGQYLSVFLQKGKSKVCQYLAFFRETIRKLELSADSKTNKEFENILKESQYANVKEFIERI